MIGRRKQMAMAAVIDVALHARGQPVPAKALAHRHGLAPRHLEPLLQDLVRANILKGTRGPRGGYELARERRRISAGDVLRALDHEEDALGPSVSPLLQDVVAPAVREAADAFLATLDRISLADLCRNAETQRLATGADRGGEFHI